MAEQDKANEGIVRIARELGRPLVATGDVHYLRREDYDNHRALLCVQTKSTLEQPKLSFDTNEFFLKTTQEMADAFAEWPEALAATVEIAERCNVEIELGKMLIPRFPTPDGEPEAAYLRRLAHEGLCRRYGDPPPAEAVERLEMELGVIEKMGFAAYFLIVWDFVRFAKDSGIAVGPGRGSAAGSIVSYALRITDVDPLEYDLLFERFLNAERMSMPDIDIDFSVKGRDRVIQYVADKYGRESVAQIVTFGRMLPAGGQPRRRARARLRLRHRRSHRQADPRAGDGPQQALRRVPGRGARSAARLRHRGRGAAGDRGGEGPRGDRAQLLDPRRRGGDRRPAAHRHRAAAAGRGPRRRRDGERSYRTVTQYSMKPIEEIGLLKMDFLGLRNLDVIEAALDIIEQSSGARPDMTRCRWTTCRPTRCSPAATRSGCSSSSPTACATRCRKVRPTEFNDLVALVALYRPGAMRYIDTYARNKRTPDAAQYPDERLRPITQSSYGVILYQEQSMQIAKAIAGFSGPEADDLRKAIGKKQRERMAALRDRFFEGARASGTAEPVIQELWAVNEAAADYSFNRSHAACYALISYRTAWLKANYPAEYMAALISSVMSTKDKVPFFVAQCEDMGIERAAARRERVRARLQGRGGQHPLRPRRGEGPGLPGGGGDHPGARGGRPVHSRVGLLPPGGLPGGQQEGQRVAREVRRDGLAVRHAHRHHGGAGAAPRRRARWRSMDAQRGQGSFFDRGPGRRGRRPRSTTCRCRRCPTCASG